VQVVLMSISLTFGSGCGPIRGSEPSFPEGPCASRISIDAIMISTQAPLALGDELFAARINRLTRLSVVACQDAAWPAHVAAAAGHSIVSQWPYALRTTPHGHSTN